MTRPPGISPAAMMADEFRRYDKIIRDIWETFHVLDQGMVALRGQLGPLRAKGFSMPSLGGGPRKPFSSQDLNGSLLHIQSRVNGARALVFALAATEDYLRYILRHVFIDNPGWILKPKDLGGTPADVEARAMRNLDRLLRGPVTSILLESEYKAGFAGVFQTKWRRRIDLYTEINARRNVWIHNQGKVDESYRKLVPSTSFRVGDMAVIDAAYVQGALITARGLCAVAAMTVAQGIYNISPRGKLELRNRVFKP